MIELFQFSQVQHNVSIPDLGKASAAGTAAMLVTTDAEEEQVVRSQCSEVAAKDAHGFPGG
jgi:hypothetical protein